MVAFGIYFSRFGWYKVQNAKPRARPSTAPSQTRAQQEAALTFHSLLGQFLTPATHAGLVCTEPGLTLMPHLGGGRTPRSGASSRATARRPRPGGTCLPPAAGASGSFRPSLSSSLRPAVVRSAPGAGCGTARAAQSGWERRRGR